MARIRFNEYLLCLSLLIGLSFMVSGEMGTCPYPPRDDNQTDASIDETLQAVEAATERLMKDIHSLDEHLKKQAEGTETEKEDAETFSKEEEALIEQMKQLAEGEPGQALFDELKKLNEELERSGIKAFGELEESSYRKGGGEGDWVVNALKEDIEACKAEMQLQGEEAATESAEKEAHGEVHASAESMGLRGNDHESGSVAPKGGMGLRENEAGGAAKTGSIGLRGNEPAGSEQVLRPSEGVEACAACDALDQDIKEAESEGERLFKELQELNPLVKEGAYKKKGDWNLATLKSDILACSPESEEGECEAATCGLDGCHTADGHDSHDKHAEKDVADGKEDRIAKWAEKFGSKTLDDAVKEAEEDATAQAANAA